MNVMPQEREPILTVRTRPRLDVLHQLHVALGHNRHGLAAAARPRRTTDTVDVVRGIARNVVVEDQLNGRNVETTVFCNGRDGREIGRRGQM
ncbi:hypothetical protein BC936DRAFT_138866 [Jimgerdemannia flammicorona]|uniref:Uncharacterized protein n=2 Tax=Jimgerdemannia flammicorona TaxID=994334 RepID=A0A433BFD1_9FUNG|nr:hypothetical protein BC936DRAFT_138866 [Jimgerdemannia flammicorona]RUS25427.1 hypothetical protein BC938DRAFT_472193 [Jimgerdemannia flammicorona]